MTRIYQYQKLVSDDFKKKAGASSPGLQFVHDTKNGSYFTPFAFSNHMNHDSL